MSYIIHVYVSLCVGVTDLVFGWWIGWGWLVLGGGHKVCVNSHVS